MDFAKEYKSTWIGEGKIMDKKTYDSKKQQAAKLQQELNTYEQRQSQIKALKNIMSNLVRETSEHKFIYMDKTVVFTAIGNHGLVYGVAKTSPGDKYEKDLGQIIAVFRAFEIPVNQVVKLVEKEPQHGGLVWTYNGTAYTNSSLINIIDNTIKTTS